MKNRILIPVLLALVTIVLWFVWTEDGSAPHSADLEGVARASAPEQPPAGALPETSIATAPVERRELASEEAVEPIGILEPGEDQEIEDARADGSVLIEVHLDLAQAAFVGGAHPYADAEVHIQAWDQETDETAPHHARADGSGVARFEFPGDVHIDWFRADMPARFGSLTAFTDPHVDVSAGSVYRLSLVPAPGGRATGRIVDVHGRPLAGVEMRAYLEGDFVRESGDLLASWYPAHYRALSGAAGYFEFPSLPSRDATFLVGPGDWVQLAPSPADDECQHEILPQGEVDVGTTKLTRREVVRLRVTDLNGRPAASALVEAWPLRFASTRLLTPEAWEERFEQDVIEEEAERLERLAADFTRWPYEGAQFETRADGRGEFVGAQGRWRLNVTPWFGDEEDMLELDVELPRAEALVVQLPYEFKTISGVVLGTEGPVERARVALRLGEYQTTVVSDERGRFRFPGAPVEGSYVLQVSHREYFNERIEVPPTRLKSRIDLRSASQIAIRIVDTEGKLVRQRKIQLVERLPGSASGPREAAAAEWAASRPTPLVSARTSTTGRWAFQHLHEGEYELSLILPVATGQLDFWGRKVAEERVWQTWTVPTATGITTLVADLRSYEPAKLNSYFTFHAIVRGGPQNQILPGAEVSITAAGVTRSIMTGSTGSFEIEVPTGRASLQISYPGYRTLVLPQRKYSGQRVNRQFRLQVLSQ